MNITLITIGKLKSRELLSICEDFANRIGHYTSFDIIVARDDKQALLKLNARDFFVTLDERGKEKSSVELAEFISDHQMKGTKRMVFFIGGPSGFGDEIRLRSNLILGLSRMTLPHEMVEAIILEQIYRAMTILKNEPYHRGN